MEKNKKGSWYQKTWLRSLKLEVDQRGKNMPGKINGHMRNQYR